MKTSDSLSDLHEIIQRAFGWLDYHLHSFTILKQDYMPINHPAYCDLKDSDMGILCESDIILSHVILLNVKQFRYNYDFGDDWYHAVQIEKVLPLDSSVQYPICIKGKRARPPEDCGGCWGYDELIQAMKKPDSSKKKKELVDWLGGPFDAEAFSLEETNARLATLHESNSRGAAPKKTKKSKGKGKKGKDDAEAETGSKRSSRR
eukprot:CAMPEP_0201492620 /NCGR_PEP_ID=MMETSP0151_2-20130828/34040_1 /ASSEMBLY_ACC=CAM_ASM_000257 /TAXON_ID=200890 /ORGANISM="Paramoeba atlantica, Strain 621/1 / CCAP 1560/9" /LENGTH=204 /DNA_ID=CAMNT_0047879537 /DNA_START=131 /DNA_END=745 /DNA_ORIENTATION=+